MRTLIHLTAGVFLLGTCAGLICLRAAIDPHVESVAPLTECPDWKNDGIPQGLCRFDERTLAFTNHFNDRKSQLYFLDSDNLTVNAVWSLPDRARHTSGLARTPRYLVSADYITNELFFFAISALIPDQSLTESFSIPTGLTGTSGCAYFEHNGDAYLAVTDHRGTGRTYILDMNRLLRLRDFDKAIASTYRNHGFSQGIAYQSGQLFESSNTATGMCSIQVRDVDDLFQLSNERASVTLIVPMFGIQDLIVEKGRILTSDEVDGHFYEIYFTALLR